MVDIIFFKINIIYKSSLNSNNPLALPLDLLVHLDVRAGGGADGVDVGAGAPDHARYGVRRHAHFLATGYTNLFKG